MGKGNDKNLRICHINSQSLTYHLDDFRIYFSKNHFHVICISESWLLPSISDDYVALPGYKIVRCDRTGSKRGGGVALFVSFSLRVKVLATSGGDYCGKPEFLIAEIQSGTNKLLLATVYRPPKTGFLNEFENTLLEHFVNYSNLIIFGDFNANLCRSTYDSNHLREFLDTSNLYLIPYNPTFHLEGSSTWLDVCAVDDADKVVSFGQRDVSFISAHDLIYVEYSIRVVEDVTRVIRARDFRNYERDRFLGELAGCGWRAIAEADNLDTKIKIFNTFVTRALDICAPFRTFSVNRSASPWFTPEIKALMVARDRARRTWPRRGTDETHRLFKLLRNQTKSAILTAKSAYYRLKFGNAKSRRDTWTELRRLGLIRSRVQTSPLPIDLEELSELFAAIGGANTPSQHCSLNPGVALYEPLYSYPDGKLYFNPPTCDELALA